MRAALRPPWPLSAEASPCLHSEPVGKRHTREDSPVKVRVRVCVQPARARTNTGSTDPLCARWRGVGPVWSSCSSSSSSFPAVSFSSFSLGEGTSLLSLLRRDGCATGSFSSTVGSSVISSWREPGSEPGSEKQCRLGGANSKERRKQRNARE